MTVNDATPQAITRKSENYAEWYTDVVRKAELADYSPVRGCMIIRPYGYTLWENVQRALDDMIKETADSFGVTSVVISHDMASVFRIGDRISMLADGVIVATGTRSEILHSRSHYLREFVETSGAVRFEDTSP